jgi:hypothetical protein
MANGISENSLKMADLAVFKYEMVTRISAYFLLLSG